MTAAGTPAPLDNPDTDGGEPPIGQRDTGHPGQIGQASAVDGAPAADDPHGSMGERTEAEDAGVVALRPPSEGGRGRPGRRWVFHGEVETISGPGAARLRAEFVGAIRDLLLWDAGEATGNSGSDEEAA
ncbi:hypothetical protein ACG83_09030 [Frankia sp. R43]|uniref:hypothetical protein n=1 Tax=Frankia sp. R43 TaxID=269536 RepID=UPI0006CA19BE|nr:hypothetical protein [Frankia sp. R43]KPM55467.1 hypothetical protein ACG83_09030 [Frankia sp. R43]